MEEQRRRWKTSGSGTNRSVEKQNQQPTRSLQLKESISTNRFENLCISESLPDDVELPLELITQILIRLPVKSLLKFKCVSKPWLFFISSPQFVRSHFSISSEADPCLNFQVLFDTIKPIRSMKQFSIKSALLYEPSMIVYDIEHPSQKPDEPPPLIAGIVNGLVLLADSEIELIVWNPVLRMSKLLPKPKFNVPVNSFRSASYAFGYDESKNDYKVFFVSSYMDSDSEAEKVMVYSLMTDSWRMIDDFRDGPIFECFGKYSNGKIHWTVGSSANERKIISMDMAREKYEELQRPDFKAGLLFWVLGELSGQLSMLYEYEDKADLWVMYKFGVEDSWSIAVSIPYDIVSPSMPYSFHQVVCILKNKDIVLSDGSDMIVYHSKRKDFRKIELGGFSSCNFFLYVESLVSPHGSGL